ncbi:MAG: C4-type zinc ribbon domain-containing protein [Verrucomicrobiae bacterium]|nr:C4-type zinc ribbon domain-containing protein [Verrucomicrobiae bacterium]
MLEVLKKLLELQECDQKILQTQDQLKRVPVERQVATERANAAHERTEATRKRIKELETQRRELELKVKEKQEQIIKYTNQQYQTKKNEEYRALAHEIEKAKQDIVAIEDQELVLMEEIENLEKNLKEHQQEESAIKKEVDEQLTELKKHEDSLNTMLASLKTKRDAFVQGVESGILARYERILKNKGGKVLVGIERGVCGGCHVRLNRQLVVDCMAQTDILYCPNCGRIIYYTPEMDVAIVE